MLIMHPILGYVSLALILVLGIWIVFAKVLGNQDELLREEEYDTNDFLYSKLRNSEALSVYCCNQLQESWRKNKKIYISLSRAKKN